MGLIAERRCGGAPAPMPLRLADGRDVLLRPVRPADLQAEDRFVQGLSPATRRLRFHGGLNALPATLLRAMTTVDPCVQVALVAEAVTVEPAGLAGAGPLIVADARYVVDEHGQAAEFAIAVADRWQGAGLGRALLRRLAAHARSRGLRRLHGEVLDHNRRMLGLLAALGAALQPLPGGVGLVHAELTLPA